MKTEKEIQNDICTCRLYDLCEFLDNEHNLSHNDKQKMAESLAIFCIRAIDKFIAGQKKHGGNIIDKNLDEEIYQELLDLYWYLNAKTWKEKNNESKDNKETKEDENINTSEVEQQSNSSRP